VTLPNSTDPATMVCNIEILSADGKVIAQAENMGLQKAFDQMPSWLAEGLSVNIAVAGNNSPLTNFKSRDLGDKT